MPKSKNVNWSIFNLKSTNGRKMNLGVLNSGLHKVLWYWKNNFGNELLNVIYMVILEIGVKLYIQKISLIKENQILQLDLYLISLFFNENKELVNE